MSDPDSLRTNALTGPLTPDTFCGDPSEAAVVTAYARRQVEPQGTSLRGWIFDGHLSPQDLAAMSSLSSDEVECAVRAGLPPAGRTEANVATVLDRLQQAIGATFTDHVRGAVREQLDDAHRLLAGVDDDAGAAAFLWDVAQSRTPQVAAGRLEALGMERGAAAGVAAQLFETEARTALRRGAIPDALAAAAAEVIERAPAAAELLADTRETFGESDPLRFARTAWREAKALGGEGSFVREAAQRAIHEAEDEREQRWGRPFATAAATLAAGPAAGVGAALVDVGLAHAEVLTQRAGVLSGLSTTGALDHAEHERWVRAAAGAVGVAGGTAAGHAAQHLVGEAHALAPVAERLAEALVEAGGHWGAHHVLGRH